MTPANTDAAQFYAQMIAYRALSLNSRSGAKQEEHDENFKVMAENLLNTPISSPADAVIKLVTAMDWMDIPHDEPAMRLLESVLTHLKDQCGGQSPPTKDPMTKAQPLLIAKTPYVASTQKVVIDRRMRPTWVDGVLYPSIGAASRSLGISRTQILKRLN